MIRPYAFDVLPEVFENPACEVVAIAAERTFWEKATILHKEAHRKPKSRNAIRDTTTISTSSL